MGMLRLLQTFVVCGGVFHDVSIVEVGRSIESVSGARWAR